MILKLENTTTHQVYEYSVVDMNNGEKLYFRFNVDTLSLDDGEYNLTLLDGDEIICKDILKLGDFKADTLQYKKGENTYIAVELNTKIGAKNVQISQVNTSIYPDDGFDAMDKVVIDAQPLYDIAFEDGNVVGYNTGKQVQKELLETVTITENGEFTKEDGWNKVIVEVPDLNGSFDDGYNVGKQDGIAEGTANAGEIIAETAQVLNITENGTYLTQYSEPMPIGEITGYLDDGTPFYSYGILNGAYFDTGIVGNTENIKRIEFWWKPGETSNGNEWQTIFGVGRCDGCNATFDLKYYNSERNRLEFRIGYRYGSFTFDNTIWNHFLIENSVLYINGVKEVSLDYNTSGYMSDTSTFLINSVWGRIDGNANGSFGVFKIGNNTFIPTADGFINYSTKELLSTNGGGYEYKEPELEEGTGNLIKTVNVNIKPKIKLADSKIKLGYSNFSEVPEYFDFNGVTNMYNMFSNCKNITTIPEINTSNVTNMSMMFSNCNNLISIPQLETSNVTDMYQMFYYCGKLTSIPELDTSNVTDMSWMFFDCTSLKSIPPLNASKVNNMSYYFRYDFFGVLDNLTDVGGWIGLKINWNNNEGLARCPNLTYQSCINILNGLADVTELGGRTLKVHSNFLTAVGDEISIATAKNWTITT